LRDCEEEEQECEELEEEEEVWFKFLKWCVGLEVLHGRKP